MYLIIGVLIAAVGAVILFGLFYYSVRIIGKHTPSVKDAAKTTLWLWLVSLLGAVLMIPLAALLLRRNFKFPWSRAWIIAVVFGVPAVLLQVVVVLVQHNFVFQAYTVIGANMSPTLNAQDYVLVDVTSRLQSISGGAFVPKRGDILVFHYPKDPTKIFIERVVGLPGDRVVVKAGAVTIYNSAHPNGYDPESGYEPAGAKTLIDTDENVKSGNLFVMGDNRMPGGSFDSREWGELPDSYVIGTVKLRLLPLDSSRGF